MRPPISREEFLKHCHDVHGDKYDYSETVYVRSIEKIKIKCKKHGDFTQLPSSHLFGRGCPGCKRERIGGLKRLDQSVFIERCCKVHREKYDYARVVFRSIDRKVEIGCPSHGFFFQKAQSHLNGSGCAKCGMKKCAGHNKHTLEQFVIKARLAHGGFYDYSKVLYKSRKHKVEITCPLHGPFWQRPEDHIKGSGCSACPLKSQSKVESLLRFNLPNWKIERHKKIWDCPHRRYCDFWLTKGKQTVMVEFDGQQHFKPVRFGGTTQKRALEAFRRQQQIDCRDKVFCDNHDIVLHRIRYDEDKENSVLSLSRMIGG